MADNGHAEAWALLYEGPEVPRELEYMHRWFQQLDGMRPEGMNGLGGFTWEMVDAWARRMDVDPEPHEFDALAFLDRVSRFSTIKLPPLDDDEEE